MQRTLPYFSKLCILSLGIILIYTLPSCATEAAKISCSEKFSNSQCVDNLNQILPELKKAKVVYLGETHDSSQDHQNQLRILKELHKNNPKLAIGMEMFQRPYQEAINQYIAGKITETELVEKTEYKNRWGFNWELYAPILRFAKEKQIPVLALNTPSEIRRKEAKEGLEKLTDEEQKYFEQEEKQYSNNPRSSYTKIQDDRDYEDFLDHHHEPKLVANLRRTKRQHRG
ncbi:MAG: ChaN family lipoprotein [Cyanobacteria bacterium J06639_18]